MPEFKRSRLERNRDEDITKKTILLGVLTVIVFVLILVFGLPLLVKFSIFLGETKMKNSKDGGEKVLPPLPPRIVLPFEATNTSKINIGGLAEANVEVELLKNDVSMGSIKANEVGEFRFEGVDLERGSNEFGAIATAERGGRSDVSKIIDIVFDDRAPEFEMLNPVESELTVDNPDFDVIGKTEKGAIVIINGRMAVIDSEGKFKLKLQLNSGKNEVEITVKDNAGNEAKKKIILTYDF